MKRENAKYLCVTQRAERGCNKYTETLYIKAKVAARDST